MGMQGGSDQTKLVSWYVCLQVMLSSRTEIDTIIIGKVGGSMKEECLPANHLEQLLESAIKSAVPGQPPSA